MPGVAVSKSGAIYLGETSRVSILNSNGSIKQIAGSASKAQMFVTQVRTDPPGNIYVVDNESNGVHKFTSDGAISTFGEGVIERELFGAESGAGGGDSTGRLEAAQGGTLFLEEIGEIPPTVQSRLVRLLADHEFERRYRFLGGKFRQIPKRPEIDA